MPITSHLRLFEIYWKLKREKPPNFRNFYDIDVGNRRNYPSTTLLRQRWMAGILRLYVLSNIVPPYVGQSVRYYINNVGAVLFSYLSSLYIYNQ